MDIYIFLKQISVSFDTKLVKDLLWNTIFHNDLAAITPGTNRYFSQTLFSFVKGL